MATTPLWTMEAMGANSRPSRFFEIAPVGRTCTLAVSRALSDPGDGARIIGHRESVGRAHDGGESACGRRTRARRTRFLLSKAQRAQTNHHGKAARRDSE